MKSLEQTVADALVEIRAEALRLATALGFGPNKRTVLKRAQDELTAWEKENLTRYRSIGDLPNCGRLRAAFELGQLFDRTLEHEGDGLKHIDRAFAFLKKFAESRVTTPQRSRIRSARGSQRDFDLPPKIAAGV